MSLWPLNGPRSRRRRGEAPVFAATVRRAWPLRRLGGGVAHFAAGGPVEAPPRRQRHRLRRLLDIVGIAAALGLFALSLDFAGFVSGLDERRPPEPRATDGIVALTGGSERISEAFDLLAEGRAKRLLITGVNLATSGSALSASLGADAADGLMNCCVDLDRNARNTVGNAIEAARWVHARNFRSVIVVTSNYHMPRSLLELGRLLPQTELIAYPVVSQNLHLDRWWQDGGSLKLLVSEYFKYLGARLKLRLEPPTLASEEAQPSCTPACP